jgi:hypothetical protein
LLFHGTLHNSLGEALTQEENLESWVESELSPWEVETETMGNETRGSNPAILRLHDSTAIPAKEKPIRGEP